MKSNKFACAVLFDLSIAFDTVDHNILLKKFCYGFQDLPFTWCESYLENREQIVFSNSIHSDSLDELPYSLPQGSVLGPLFFLLYINDINYAISLSYFHLYADDTIIIRASNCTVDLLSSMESELASLDDWFVLNKLTPNKKKCEIIFFANQVNIKKCSGLTIKFCGNLLIQRPFLC